MKSKEAEVLHILAYALFQNAQAEKAATLYEALDTLEPNNTRTLLALAATQLRASMPARALLTLDRLPWDEHSPAAAHLLKAQTLSILRRYPEAQLAMQRFLALRAKQVPGVAT